MLCVCLRVCVWVESMGGGTRHIYVRPPLPTKPPLHPQGSPIPFCACPSAPYLLVLIQLRQVLPGHDEAQPPLSAITTIATGAAPLPRPAARAAPPQGHRGRAHDARRCLAAPPWAGPVLYVCLGCSGGLEEAFEPVSRERLRSSPAVDSFSRSRGVGVGHATHSLIQLDQIVERFKLMITASGSLKRKGWISFDSIRFDSIEIVVPAPAPVGELLAPRHSNAAPSASSCNGQATVMGPPADSNPSSPSCFLLAPRSSSECFQFSHTPCCCEFVPLACCASIEGQPLRPLRNCAVDSRGAAASLSDTPPRTRCC